MDPQDPRHAAYQGIRAILAEPTQRGGRLLEALTSFGVERNLEPFRFALQSLIHLDRSEAQARSLFEAIDQHRASLEVRLGRDPGLSVACLDLLHDVEGSLRDPIFRESAPTDLPAGTERTDRTPVDRFDEILVREARRGERFGKPMTVVLLGPDGPAEGAGDWMEAAAGVLRDLRRDCDHAARLVPDGFALVLPCTGGAEAWPAAERLRQALRAPTGVSWSAGVASCPDLGWDATAIAGAARQALAAARDAGGDAVRVFRPERRAHARRRPAGVSLAALLRWDGGEAAAEIEDLSLGGAQVRVSERIAPDSRVTLAVRETSVRPHDAILASRVIRTDEQSGPPGSPRFRLGVSFLDSPGGSLRVAALLADLAVDAAAVRGNRA